jgi:hypothetical protein
MDSEKTLLFLFLENITGQKLKDKPLSEKLKDTFNITIKVPETRKNNKKLRPNENIFVEHLETGDGKE